MIFVGLLWGGLVAAATQVPQATVDSDYRLVVSAQVGVGALDEELAALIRPRLAFKAGELELVLAAPMWLRLAEHSGSRLVYDDDPEFVVGFVERLSYQTDGVRLFAGDLVQQTLGHGVLVDHFCAHHDPLHPRTGGRADFYFDELEVSALIDSFIRPHVAAASVRLAPLAMVGTDAARRFSVAVEGAVDLRAPRAAGQSPVGGLDMDIAYGLWRFETLAIDLYLAGAYLSKPAWGAHAGAELAYHSSRTRAVRLRLEAVAAGPDYAPGYFDEAYSVERFFVPDPGGLPKAEQRRAGRTGVRSAADLHLSSVQLGLSVTTIAAHAPLTFSTYARVVRPTWSAAAILVQRSVSHAGDLLRMGPASRAMVEAAYTLWGGAFAFSHLRRTFRHIEGHHGRLVVDWIVGLGYAAQAGQAPGP